MFTRKRESFEDFLENIQDFDLVQKYAERCNEIAGTSLEDLTFLPYDLLKNEIPEMLKAGQFERVIFEIVAIRNKNLKFKVIERENNYKKLRFIFWIQDQYKLIDELERKYLSTPPDAKMINAGIRELDVLGDVNLIDSLAGGDVLKWQQIRSLPYSVIFDKQLKNTIEARINKKLAKEREQGKK